MPTRKYDSAEEHEHDEHATHENADDGGVAGGHVIEPRVEPAEKEHPLSPASVAAGFRTAPG